jgi:hypothetical protein
VPARCSLCEFPVEPINTMGDIDQIKPLSDFASKVSKIGSTTSLAALECVSRPFAHHVLCLSLPRLSVFVRVCSPRSSILPR